MTRDFTGEVAGYTVFDIESADFILIKTKQDLEDYFNALDHKQRIDMAVLHMAAGRSYWPEFAEFSTDGIRHTPDRGPAA